jgi:hypothetical protein
MKEEKKKKPAAPEDSHGPQTSQMAWDAGVSFTAWALLLLCKRLVYGQAAGAGADR